MANYLKFNIYNVDLNDISCNSNLRKMLNGTNNLSILIIEDFNCSFKFPKNDKTSFHNCLTYENNMDFICTSIIGSRSNKRNRTR